MEGRGGVEEERWRVKRRRGEEEGCETLHFACESSGGREAGRKEGSREGRLYGLIGDFC
jgi:hypothetical protein